MVDLLKVKTTSNPNAVAGAIANILKTQKTLKVQAIGAGSLNQAVKSLAIARSYLVLSGNDFILERALNICSELPSKSPPIQRLNKVSPVNKALSFSK